jgi:hypothetical protein
MLRPGFEVKLFTPMGVLCFSGAGDIGDGTLVSWASRAIVQKKGRQI